ncbi:hypothetical protein AB4Z32_27220 [Massilia sp. 2TAF26]|uniref:hypothetical protein n=1 Tax=Massilia sp. 2TAF26 TaxID=3233012 RepID=UPI003F98B03E
MSLELLESSKDDFSTGSLRYQTIVAPAVMPLAATVDAEVRILSTYRKAISTSTAVILTDTQAAAKVFNFTLHEEQMEVRKFERLPTPVVRLANDYVATIGDALVCHQSDYKRGLTAGSTGKIIDITQPIVLAGDGSANTALVRAFIDTIGEVELSTSDCLRFQLGYAIPTSLDKWSSYDVRIVFLGSGQLPKLSDIRRLINKTKSFLYIASSDEKSISSLIANLHQPREE